MEKDEVCLRTDKPKVHVENRDSFMLDVESQIRNKKKTYVHIHSMTLLSYLVIILIYVMSEQTNKKYTFKEETI